jgi:ribosomal protein S18
MALFLAAGKFIRRLPISNISKVIVQKNTLIWKSTVAFSSSSDSGKKDPKDFVPDNFFDDEAESEKEFLDMASSLIMSENAPSNKDENYFIRAKSGLETLTSMSEPSLTWDQLEQDLDIVPDIPRGTSSGLKTTSVRPPINLPESEENLEFESSLTHGLMMNTALNEDIAEHVETAEPQMLYMPPAMLNYTIPWKMTEENEAEGLDNFMGDRDEESYRFDQQGSRACGGKKQRKGKTGVLECHKIDLDKLHHLDVVMMERFLSEDSEILGKGHTGLCSKCQRRVAQTIKRARAFGILSHLGQYVITDARPLHKSKIFHDNVHVDKREKDTTKGLKISKTIDFVK